MNEYVFTEVKNVIDYQLAKLLTWEQNLFYLSS